MEKRTISTELIEEDYKIENSLRPKFLKDYIGQRKVKENLEIYIKAAKARKEALDRSLYAKKPEGNDMARKCCREPRKKLKRQVGKELNCLLNVVCHSFI